MSFYFSKRAQSILRICLDALVDEIGCRLGIVFIGLLNYGFNLLGHHLVSYLVSVLAPVRSFPNHAFISNDSKCKVVCSKAMVSLEHNFWRHVPRRSRLQIVIVVILACILICDSEICKPQIPLVIEHDVFRL